MPALIALVVCILAVLCLFTKVAVVVVPLFLFVVVLALIGVCVKAKGGASR